MIRVRHREGLHTHSGRTSDTLWDLNFELGVDAVVVLLGTVDDDILVMMAIGFSIYNKTLFYFVGESSYRYNRPPPR